MIGGTGTLIGPLYGSVILVYLKSIAGTFTAHHLMIVGAIFIAVVIFFPRGLIGYAKTVVVARGQRAAGSGGGG
jgi:branched-chain amino acid transport system permease protein